MKYRIIAGSNDLLPYIVQRKNEKSVFPFWRKVTKFRTLQEAENLVRRSAERHAKHSIGQTITEYDEADVVVDRLKNRPRIESDSGEASPMVPFSG